MGRVIVSARGGNNPSCFLSNAEVEFHGAMTSICVALADLGFIVDSSVLVLVEMRSS